MKTSKLLLTTAIIASLGTTAFAADSTNQISGNLNQVEGDNNIIFRIEVIDQNGKDIRNIIWESKQGFLEACSIKKYIQHLTNKETYQIWVKDHVDSESICKFAD